MEDPGERNSLCNCPKKSLFMMLIGSLLVLDLMAFVTLERTMVIPWLLLFVITAVIVFQRRQKERKFVQWKDEYSPDIELIYNYP